MAEEAVDPAEVHHVVEDGEVDHPPLPHMVVARAAAVITTTEVPMEDLRHHIPPLPVECGTGSKHCECDFHYLYYYFFENNFKK